MGIFRRSVHRAVRKVYFRIGTGIFLINEWIVRVNIRNPCKMQTILELAIELNL